MRHIDNGKFAATIFRRTYAQIDEVGGLWDKSMELYPNLFGEPNGGDYEWTFRSGMRVAMRHLQHAKSHLNYQGAEMPWIGFDELTHFEEGQFWYMTSRLRSMSGVKGVVRASCNPDPDSFVAKLIAWWIDQQTGFPLAKRSGLLRWFVRIGGTLEFDDTKQALIDRFGELEEIDQVTGKRVPLVPKSLTFIPSRLQDNPILMKKDPEYIAWLRALPPVEQARLLGGNWKVRQSGGMFLQNELLTYEEAKHLPIGTPFACCDAAYSGENAGRRDWTAFVAGVVVQSGEIYIVRSWRRHLDPDEFIDAIFQEMAELRYYNFETLHVEGNKFVKKALEQRMVIDNFRFAVEDLDHGGKSKTSRIRLIRVHLKRLRFRKDGDEVLMNDLIAYNPDNEGKVPDDLADALAYLCSIVEFRPTHLSKWSPVPENPVLREIFLKKAGKWSTGGGKSKMG